MEHPNASGRGGGGTQGLEPVLPRRVGQAVYDRHPVPDHRTDERAENVGKQRTGVQLGRQPAEAEDDGGSAVLVEVEACRRRPTCDRRTDVDEIAVAVGARTEHRVGEGDGVRLGPGDLLAEGGPFLQLVGGTCPGGPTTHADVGIHETPGQEALLGIPSVQVGVQEVERRHVQGRGHDDGRPVGGQAFGEVQRSPPVVQARVDMGGGDVEQFLGTEGLRQADHHSHRQSDGWTIAPVQATDIVFGQMEGHLGSVGGRPVRRVSRGSCRRMPGCAHAPGS